MVHENPPPVWIGSDYVWGTEQSKFLARNFLAYLLDVDAAPPQPADETLPEVPVTAVNMHPSLLDELWRECGAGQWGVEREQFDRIVLVAGIGQNFGLKSGTTTTHEQQAAFFRTVKLADLVLAKACAAGNERAWEQFMALYSQPLTRAAIAISGSETVGRDLADAFYAELYGLTIRAGQRKCPLDSYRGRGSLLGWLRTTLAQRFVDHYRRTFREESLEERAIEATAPDTVAQAHPAMLATLSEAVQAALRRQPAEERFLLAAYFVDGRTLAEIGKMLGVHEATISRRLRRTTETVRKQLLHNLERSGMSRKAAEEALGTDPRDVDLKMDVKKLLQNPEREPFSKQALANAATRTETLAGALLSDTRETLRNPGESFPERRKT
jgi:RNA polymerase sigma-70 factor, ECF subfamily